MVGGSLLSPSKGVSGDGERGNGKEGKVLMLIEGKGGGAKVGGFLPALGTEKSHKLLFPCRGPDFSGDAGI